jgi:hypothetical protein
MSKTLKIVLIVLAGLVLVAVGGIVSGLIQDNAQDQELSFSIIVSAPGSFTIDMNPKNAVTGDIEVEVVKGTPAVFTITTAAVGGYDGKINFSVGGLVAGTYAFSANDVAPGVTVTLTVQTSGLTSNTTYVCGLTASPA